MLLKRKGGGGAQTWLCNFVFIWTLYDVVGIGKEDGGVWKGLMEEVKLNAATPVDKRW